MNADVDGFSVRDKVLSYLDSVKCDLYMRILMEYGYARPDTKNY